MQTEPATRCQHVKTSGVQCGSPALRNLKFCYYHQQGRSQAIRYYDEAPYTAIDCDLPLFEDAHSIQLAIRQVAHMLMHNIVDTKKAGLLLYSLQLASANLKQMKTEIPQQSQIVVDLDRIAGTPLETAPALDEPTECFSAPHGAKRKRKPGEQSEEEIQAELNYLLVLGEHLDEPAERCGEVEEARRAADDIQRKREAKDGLPPGTIRACIDRPRYEGKFIN
jgi:hypothetical protein